ncbi:GRB10-interacting GYF protein 2 [Cyclospora cayetanensis]|uniref:GRB10-interacting GYF protein 2 n=1 Tax=Cyclospora cayetanensis TaxID=88456 RepID=A0A6P6RXZ3_9EIME|nr:GRB10-interacting GYF protein 2 [Cyclospora cayetanensis]
MCSRKRKPRFPPAVLLLAAAAAAAASCGVCCWGSFAPRMFLIPPKQRGNAATVQHGSGISHSRLAALSAQQKQQQQQKKEKEIVQRRRANQEKQRQRLLQQKEERRQAKKSRQQQQHEQLEDKDRLGDRSKEELAAKKAKLRLQQQQNRKEQLRKHRLLLRQRQQQANMQRLQQRLRLPQLRTAAREAEEQQQQQNKLGSSTTREGKALKLRETKHLLQTSLTLVRLSSSSTSSDGGKEVSVGLTNSQKQRMFDALVQRGLHKFVLLKRIKNSLMRTAILQLQQEQQQQQERKAQRDVVLEDEEMHARLWGRWDDPPLSEDEFLEAFGVDASSLEDKEEAAEGAPAPSGSSKSGAVGSSSKSGAVGSSSKSGAKKKKGGGKGSGVASSGSACDGDAQQLPQDLSSMDLPEPANYAEAVEAAAEAEQRAMAAIRVAGASRSVAESAALLLPHLEGECLYAFVHASAAAENRLGEALQLLLQHAAEAAADNRERATEASQDIGRRKPGDKYTLVPVEGMPPLEALPIFRQPRSRAAGKAAKGVEAVAAASTAAAAAKAAAAEAALGAPPPAACTPFPLVKVLVLTPDRIIPPASVSLLAKLPDRKSLTARLLETFLTPTFRLLSAVQYAPRLLSASLRAKQQQLLGILRLCYAATSVVKETGRTSVDGLAAVSLVA